MVRTRPLPHGEEALLQRRLEPCGRDRWSRPSFETAALRPPQDEAWPWIQTSSSP